MKKEWLCRERFRSVKRQKSVPLRMRLIDVMLLIDLRQSVKKLKLRGVMRKLPKKNVEGKLRKPLVRSKRK